jgi:PAS domain S-box-containing protein
MNEDIRILIIEDDPEDIERFTKSHEMGECSECIVDFVSTGAEGLELCKKHIYQVIITDYHTDSISTLDLVESLKTQPEPPLVIVITDQGDEEIAVQLLKNGVSDYLVKDQSGMYLKLMPRVVKKSLNERYLLKQKEDAFHALKESQERYQRLEENLLGVFVYSHNTNGVITYVSPSVKKVLGYFPEEFMNHYSTYLTDHPINKEVDLLTQLSIMGIPQKPYEVEIFHKNGTIHRLLVSEIPVFDDHGKVIAVEGIAKDISALHKTYTDQIEDK